MPQPAVKTNPIAEKIGTFPDFPKPGILFYDINPLLACPESFQEAISQMASYAKSYQPDIIIGIESRGFLFAPSLAAELKMPFGLIRKKGKLPGDVITHSYEKEYGKDTLEVQKTIIGNGQRVLLIDDLLATGGTMKAAISLIEKAGGIPLASIYLIELLGLAAAETMPIPQHALLQY